MNWPGELKRRLQMLFHRRAFQRELEEEMKPHLDLREEQQIEDGTAPEAARVAARRLFGKWPVMVAG